MKRFMRTENVPMLIPRILVGLIFLSEGIQKFIFPELLGMGRFAKIGFAHPEFWASFTACFEITYGILVFIGFLTRIASIPLLIIMATAFVTTKYPLIVETGLWVFAHEYRTDFAMTMLLLLLIQYGGGKYSLDRQFLIRSIIRSPM
jgi:putative oxidoreductase